MLLLRESVRSVLGIFCVGGALAAPFVSELRAFVAPPANSGGPLCSGVGVHCPYSESDGVVA